MTKAHNLLDYAVYSYAIFWTALIIVFIYQSRLRQHKFFRWIFRLVIEYQIKTDPQLIIKQNLNNLSSISKDLKKKRPNIKIYNFSGVQVAAENPQKAHLIYDRVKKLKSSKDIQKMQDYVKTL
ncbi:hypothetical protein [Bizionia myxarmorum]|uniref:Uncharacterized protein n=1 Tax=Bizionia myxarmorum TaxID=291186 RepID=A0A5D0RC86_9FLAO|nr:hypothetical protein [Bizionia myxarmorum]TYB78318.1 hypothetical protein ES674_00630 [Bizionia myxarmorum]